MYHNAVSVLLAIETSQRVGSVALRATGGTIHVEYLCANKNGRHGDDLMPAIDRLFHRIDQVPCALGTVAVSIGPGGFTGLRIAVSTAKMFAETLGAKVIAVPSALVAVENVDLSARGNGQSAIGMQASDRAVRILIALAAKRETFWATRLERRADVWSIISEPGLVEADSVDLTDIAALIADEHLPTDARERAEAIGVPVIVPHLDASACLRVAERMATQDQYSDPLMLLPLYPRPPEAVTIWESRVRNAPSGR